MKRFTQIATGIAAVAVLVAPSAASAHTNASVSSVRAHVRNADQALTMVAGLVKGNDDAAAAIAMVQNLRQTQAATRESGRIRGRAKKAKALQLVAAQRTANVDTLTALVDDVSGDVQTQMATALTYNLTGRQTAIAQLTALAPTLPAAAQMGIATAISAISNNGPSEVAAIASAAKSGQIGAGATAPMAQALTQASTAMFTGVGQLQQIVGMLPAQAQGPVNAAIARVTGILQSIFGTGAAGSGTAGGPAGGILSGLPIPSSLPIPCGLPLPSFLPFARPC